MGQDRVDQDERGNGGGAGRRKQSNRGGARPVPAERALPSFVWIKNWPWSNTRACVAHLATQGTGLRRGAPCAAAAATLGWLMSPARNARTPKACYGPKQRVQRIEGWLLVLTGVQGCRGSRAEGATARTGGGNSAWWSRAGRCGDLWLLVTSIRRVVKL